MTRVIRSELIRMWRPRTATLALLLTAIYAVGGTFLLINSISDNPLRGLLGGPTATSLAEAGGGTEVVSNALAFAGFFLLVAFAGFTAVEFSRGTMRTMALRQPARLALLAGKLSAMVVSAAVLLAVAVALGWVTALAVAPSRDIETTQWVSLDALEAAGADYGRILVWATGYAVLGSALAVLVRSVPITLGIAIAWAGPFEHILVDAWSGASQYFPGLLLETFVAGGTPLVSSGQALGTSAAYAASAATVAAVVFTRRDVT